MPLPLSERIALVTGASRGIGYATALALAKVGAHVVAVARTVGGLEELDDAVRKLGGSATLVPLDLNDYPGIDRLGLALHERFGRLDVLIGNAAVLGPLSPLGHVEAKAWDEVMAVNVTANWRLIRAMDPLLRASDAGRVVFVSSGVAALAAAYWGPYAVSKAALETLARTYAAETATTNVRVNLFAPDRFVPECAPRRCRARIRCRWKPRTRLRRRSSSCACRRCRRAVSCMPIPSRRFWNFARHPDGAVIRHRLQHQNQRLPLFAYGFFFSRSVSRIGVPGRSKLSRKLLTR